MNNVETGENAVSPELNRYIEMTRWIRELSTPRVAHIESADDYRVQMQRNFTRIGELARINTDILERHYYPMIRSEHPLTGHELDRLNWFAEELVNAFNLDNLDLPIAYLQAERMVRDAEEKWKASGETDDKTLIRALDEFVIVSYAMMYMTLRLVPVFNVALTYRDRGIAAAERIISYLAPEKFSMLDEASRELVLINARYIRALYERPDALNDAEKNAKDLETIRRAFALYDDPFYRDLVPSYDWRYHNFRTLEYCSNFTEQCNERGFDETQLAEINECAKRLDALYESDPDYFSTLAEVNNIKMYRDRNAYLNGEITKRDYKDRLFRLFLTRCIGVGDQPDLSAVLAPIEYIAVLDRDHLTKKEEQNLNRFYRELVAFMHTMSHMGTLSTLVNYLAIVLKKFVEIPGGISYEDMGLSLMAAMHPPTYVHSLSVASFAKSLCASLLDRQPELFVGTPGFPDVAAVKKGKKKILDFVYHAGLCHDFGKLMIIETILTYGRALLPDEIDLIRKHPEIGAYLLKRQESTAPYVDIALGHHKWYNNQGGYPDSFDMEHTPYKTLISVVACADCLDASTDAVGRSYKAGKSLDHYLAELHEGSGTRYAPYLAELLADREVRAEVEMMLAKGREENYRNAYHVLSMHERN